MGGSEERKKRENRRETKDHLMQSGYDHALWSQTADGAENRGLAPRRSPSRAPLPFGATKEYDAPEVLQYGSVAEEAGRRCKWGRQ